MSHTQGCSNGEIISITNGEWKAAEEMAMRFARASIVTMAERIVEFGYLEDIDLEDLAKMTDEELEAHSFFYRSDEAIEDALKKAII